AKARKELQEKRVPGDVIRHSKGDVCTALCQVEAEEGLAPAVDLHVEHEQEVTRWKPARLCISRRPRRDDEPPAHGISFELTLHPFQLVVMTRLPLRILAWEIAPKVAIRAR